MVGRRWQVVVGSRLQQAASIEKLRSRILPDIKKSGCFDIRVIHTYRIRNADPVIRTSTKEESASHPPCYESLSAGSIVSGRRSSRNHMESIIY